jgi:hypothetical protein
VSNDAGTENQRKLWSSGEVKLLDKAQPDIKNLTPDQQRSFFLTALVAEEYKKAGVNAKNLSPFIDVSRRLSSDEGVAVEVIAKWLKQDENPLKMAKGKPLSEERIQKLARSTFEIYQKYRSAGLINESEDGGGICIREGMCFSLMVVQDISKDLLSKFITMREQRSKLFRDATEASDSDAKKFAIGAYSKLKEACETIKPVASVPRPKDNRPLDLAVMQYQYYLSKYLVDAIQERNEFVDSHKA